jgi:hypothetical protein
MWQCEGAAYDGNVAAKNNPYITNTYNIFVRRTKCWIFRLPAGKQTAPSKQLGTDPSMKTMVAACLLLGLSATAASAIDLAELAPCKPAAARMCDRSAGLSWSNLLQCGATLAAHSWRVSSDCRAVLKKYGQL